MSTSTERKNLAAEGAAAYDNTFFQRSAEEQEELVTFILHQLDAGERGDTIEWNPPAWVDEELNTQLERAVSELRDRAPDSRPEINVDNFDLETTTAQLLDALHRANTPARYFEYGGNPCRLDRVDGKLTPRLLTLDRMRHEAARIARYVKFKRTRQGEDIKVPSMPPMSGIRDAIASPDLQLPKLERIVTTPVFAKTGELLLCDGYHPSGVYLKKDASLRIPEIAENPGAEDVAEARYIITDELLGDFPFVTQADRTNSVAELLLPFARDLIEGATPGHLTESSTPGSGKGLKSSAVMIPGAGANVATITEGRDEDEWRKRITAALHDGRPVVRIDNVHRLDSAALNAAITEPLWTDRILGKTETSTYVIRTIWQITANNPVLSTEMARRLVRIRLEPATDRPWERTDFKHPSLESWAWRNRSLLIWAALTLIQSWIAAGRPSGNSRAFGSFQEYSDVMGGILDHVEIPGFLDNRRELFEEADDEGETWRSFAAAWWDQHGSSPVKASQLFELATESGLNLGRGTEQSQKVKLGTLIKKQRGRIFGEYRLEKAGTTRRAALWRLQKGESCESGECLAPDDCGDHLFENSHTDMQGAEYREGGNTRRDSQHSHAGAPTGDEFTNDNPFERGKE